ncbi:hypothetical protein AALC25_08925 [Lachnospiraceae bacterium 29-84]
MDVQDKLLEKDGVFGIMGRDFMCNIRDRRNVSFTGVPRFVMEVLSDATEKYDRTEKMIPVIPICLKL